MRPVGCRTEQFVLDKEKQKFKVKDDHRKANYETTQRSEFRPFASTTQTKGKKEKPSTELNNPCFIGQTSYKATFQNWGANPPLMPVKEWPKVMNVKFDHKSMYTYEFEEKQKNLDQNYL